MLTYLSHSGYENNPIVQYCLSKTKERGIDYQIVDLKDLLPDLDKCKHSKYCYEHNMNSYVFDQLRLYLALGKEMMYADLDSIGHFDELPINSVAVSFDRDKDLIINNGSYFYTSANHPFNQYYYDLYEKDDIIKTGIKEGHHLVNYEVFARWPMKETGLIGVQPSKIDGIHYYVSQFSRYKRICENYKVVYYTTNRNKIDPNHIYWQLGDQDKFNAIGSLGNQVWFYNLAKLRIPLDIWKEQMRYTLNNPSLLFIEV